MHEHAQFGHPNYWWSRVVCSACENGVPALYALPNLNETAEQVQGSISKQFVGDQEDSPPMRSPHVRRVFSISLCLNSK